MGKLRMGAALIHANGQTDRQTDRRIVGQTGGRMNMTTLTGAFRESANAPTNSRRLVRHSEFDMWKT